MTKDFVLAHDESKIGTWVCNDKNGTTLRRGMIVKRERYVMSSTRMKKKKKDENDDSKSWMR